MMIYLAYAVFFAWVPTILFFFSILPPHRALILSYIVGWLYLPMLYFQLPGIPDLEKASITTGGVFLGILIFDLKTVLAFRFRWYDLPAIGFCVAPILSVLSNGISFNEGLSFFEREMTWWGMPYLLGRMYLNSTENLRDYAIGIVVGGLSYVPLCLYEIRFSPMLNVFVYGFYTPGWEGFRFGGYRPRVFLSNGLECGMWMAVVSLVAYRCWARGSIRTLGNWPFGLAVVILLGITILCKATGAIFLLIVGLIILWAVRVTRSPIPIMILVAIPYLYSATRSTGIWSGRGLTEAIAANFSEDRAISLQYRFDCEDRFIEKANRKWLFGWGPSGRYRIYDEKGNDQVISDGMWIITYGSSGAFGLVCFLLFLNLPIITLMRRNPVATWSSAALAPAAAFAVSLSLYAIDNLFNGMRSVNYPLIAGGVIGLPAIGAVSRRSGLKQQLDLADELALEGRYHEAAMAYREVVASAPRLSYDAEAYRDQARAYDGLAGLMEAGRNPGAAESERRSALEIREYLAESADATVDDRRTLALTLSGLAHDLGRQGREGEALAFQRRSVIELAELAPISREDHRQWVVALNDLAWLMATADEPEVRDPEQAVLLARRATIESPTTGAYWNTLGVACFRAGDDPGAIQALDRSIKLGPPGGTAFDLLFRAMACFRMGDEPGGSDALARGIAWADRHQPNHPGLARFRREAQSYVPNDVRGRLPVRQA
ncbi:hypothetical protein TA3x_005766 (plasmid) [Tundrisphaera sp. TA3]|uniref:hypothetical protein n=1 Tax=Tundrisphaera sp. TA3 TaxID=3435775 RepID=UPI003EBB1176